MSKSPKGGPKFSKGGKPGRGPGRGSGLFASTNPGQMGAGKRPAKGYGSKRLGGRPPKGPGII